MRNRSPCCPLYRRAALRALKSPVPQTRRPGFAAECRRQARITACADAADPELVDFLDRAFDDAS